MTADLRALAERAASAIVPHNEYTGCPSDEQIADAIERVATEYARQAVEAEREACAKVCNDNAAKYVHSYDASEGATICSICADDIRARTNLANVTTL